MPHIKKPKSVLALQILGGVISSLLLIGLVRTSVSLLQSGASNATAGALVGFLSYRVAAVVLMATTFYLLNAGSPKARTTGLAWIGIFFANTFYVQFVDKSPPTLPRFECSNAADCEFGEILGGALQLWLIAFWFYLYGFSSKARQYFAAP